MALLASGSCAGDETRLLTAQMAAAVVAEVNRMRRDPAAYAKQMSELLPCYSGKTLRYPHTTLELTTTEGVGGATGCLTDLQCTPSLPSITLSQALSRACERHLADAEANDHCSHIGSDGSTPEARVASAGQYREQCGENLILGMESAKEMVYHMLLDDGAPDRGHRANLLNPDFRFAGVAYRGHPSAGSALVMLFVDHFRARPPPQHELLREVATAHLGAGPGDGSGPLGARGDAHRQWDQLMQDTKPDHLRVPGHLLDRVHTYNKPELYVPVRKRIPRIPLGDLNCSDAVDPAIIRAFVHRVDGGLEDTFNEEDILKLSHTHQLDFTPEVLEQMFDEILNLRLQAERARRKLVWAELAKAVQVRRAFVSAVDVHVAVEDGSSYILSTEAEALADWCKQVHSAFAARCPELPAPPRGLASNGTAGSRHRGGAERVAEVDAFLEVVLRRLHDEAVVQRFLGAGLSGAACGAEPEPARPKLQRAVCMGQRRLWAYKSRPHRDRWLRLIRASGLNPMVALPEKRAAAQRMEDKLAMERSANVRAEEETLRATRNVARPDPALSPSIPSGTGKMRLRDPPTRVTVRPALEEGAAADPQSPGSPPGTGPGGARTQPWLEKQAHTETLVNKVIQGQLVAVGADAVVPDDAGAAAEVAPKGYTFEARRKFQQVLASQSRASDEQRFLSSQGGRGSASAGQLGAGRRGTGAHSLAAPFGIKGHFHNSDSLASGAADGGHAWPRSLDVRWDGEHIDHTKLEEMRPNPKYSKMSAEEKGKQFSCYFGANVHCANIHKKKVAKDQSLDLLKQSSVEHEFRPDVPQRHGKFGRRAFDAQVREKPLNNPHGTSEIDTKPVEEFNHTRDLIQEYLERALPKDQTQHFEQYLPQADMPKKHQELATSAPVHSIMDGAHKRQEHGFFQNRHSDMCDMNLYARPLHSGHLDRQVPLA